jgi:hypothetical protein
MAINSSEKDRQGLMLSSEAGALRVGLGEPEGDLTMGAMSQLAINRIPP